MTGPVDRRPPRSRRAFLASAGIVGASALAGCGGLLRTEPVGEPPVVENRPDAVYYPTHVEGMAMVGGRTVDGWGCALAYTVPHRFWLADGADRQRVPVADADDAHLMAVVWDDETGVITPDAAPSMTVSRDGERVGPAVAPWPMLSQQMGLHFGDNVRLDGEGTYRVAVRVGPPSLDRVGPFADGATTLTFDWEFSRETLAGLSYDDVPAEREGTRGAVEPTEMGALPAPRLPAPEALPGDLIGTATAGDAAFAVAVLKDGDETSTDDDPALVVSPRTPHNRYPLPLASLSARVTRGGEEVAAEPLAGALHPGLHHHYRATVPDLASGDEVEIAVDAPPQVSRHEGYETAFFDFESVTLTV